MHAKLPLPSSRHTVAAALCLATGLPHTGFAQTASPDTPGKTVAADTVLEDLKVTASKIGEKSVQATSASLAAFNHETLTASLLQDATGLTDYVPNVQIGRSFNAVEIAIRGIASTNNTEVGDPAAGFSLDGLSFGRPEAAAIPFFDLERVEVLRGPQGTLYGRNTLAGAVNLVSRRPAPGFSTGTSLTIANHRAVSAEGFVNNSLGDKAAFRASLATNRSDGWIASRDAAAGVYDDAGWTNNQSARLQFQAEPAPDLSLRLSYQVARLRGSSNPFVMRPLDGSTPARTLISHLPNRQDETFWSLGAEASKRFAAMRLTYIGGVSGENLDMDLVYAMTPLPAPFFIRATNRTHEKSQSHELRLTSARHANLDWVSGLYYFKETNDVAQLVPVLNLGFVQPDVRSESTAAFAHATYTIARDTRVLGGLRHTRDRKARQGGVFAVAPDGTIGTRYSENNADRAWDSDDFQAGLEYDLAAQSMLYGTVSTGYKAGGFYDGTGDVYYKPESLTSYELGIRNQFLERRVKVNVTGFHYDYRNFQVSSIEITPSTGQIGTVTRNIPSLPVDGAEFEASIRISNTDQLDLGASHLRTRFRHFLIGATDIFGQRVERDLSGNQAAKAPEWSLQWGYQHTISVARRATLECRIHSRWCSGYYISYDNHPLPPHPVNTWQGPFTTTDAGLTYRSSGNRWSAGVFVKHLEDGTLLATHSGNTAGDVATLEAPRTYGVQLGAEF